MSKDIFLSGFFIDNEKNRRQITPFKINNYNEIENFIYHLSCYYCGIIILSDNKEDDDEVDYHDLYIYKDGEIYMPVLNKQENGELEIKNINKEKKGFAIIHGEPYPLAMTTNNEFEILRLCYEFYYTQNVKSMI